MDFPGLFFKFKLQEWDNAPWSDIMELTLTTALPPSTVQRTYFNVINRPPCLGFGKARSIWDYRSYAEMLVTMYTKQELDRMEQVIDGFTVLFSSANCSQTLLLGSIHLPKTKKKL